MNKYSKLVVSNGGYLAVLLLIKNMIRRQSIAD